MNEPKVFDGAPGPEVSVEGRAYVYFGGTGYLGIQRRPELAAASDAAMRRYGLHPASSRVGFGDTPPLREAEQEAARFFGTEAAWLLPSGWMGAAVLLRGHSRPGDRLFLDGEAHFCLQEAAQASGRPVSRFGPRDAESLRVRLAADLQRGERPIVLTDGVFAVSGRIAPLRDYRAVLRGYEGGHVLVDDAHGFGVVGATGRGTGDWHGLQDDPTVLVTGTASKALGGYGGLITGTTRAIRHLQGSSDSFAGSTPLPTPVAAATAAALRIARDEPGLRAQLAANVRFLRRALRELGFEVEDLPTPIIPLALPTAEAMRRLHERLAQAGILVPYLSRYVGAGEHGVLRIAVFATHQSRHLEQLLAALRRHA